MGVGETRRAAGVIGVSWQWPEAFDLPHVDVILRAIGEIQMV
jgi:hypothetical protein